MLSACSTLILVILHYLSNQQDCANHVDRRFINMIKPTTWKEANPKDCQIWTAAMEASVLMFSDMQVITGMAILLCGYTQLRNGLSSYHWEIIVSLAWFSSLTHLATLTSLRDYFRARPAMALCRAGFMGVVLVTLAISFGTTGYIPQFGSTESPSWPASCLFSPKSMSKVGASDPRANFGNRPLFNQPLVLLSILFLVLSYLTRVTRIFNPTAGLAKRWLGITPRRIMIKGYVSAARSAEQASRSARVFWDITKFLRALVYVLFEALFGIGESMLWEVGGNLFRAFFFPFRSANTSSSRSLGL